MGIKLAPGALKQERERLALSQRDLAAASGVTLSTINRIEQGLQDPYPATVRKLAAALGVTPAALIDHGQESA